MNAAALVLVPSVTEKSVVPLNTCPVGVPPGMVTLNGWEIGLPATSPPYSSLSPVPLADTQNVPPVGLSEMPKAFTRVGSVTAATPGRSETRSVARNAVLGLCRSSSRWTPRRARGTGTGRDPPANNRCHARNMGMTPGMNGPCGRVTPRPAV